MGALIATENSTMMCSMVPIVLAAFVAAQVLSAPAELDFTETFEMAQAKTTFASGSAYASAGKASAYASGKKPRPGSGKAPAPPRKPAKGELVQVTTTIGFSLKLPFTAAEFTGATKKAVIGDMAKQLKVKPTAITATIVTRRRQLLGVDTILAEAEAGEVNVKFTVTTVSTAKDAKAANEASKKLEASIKKAADKVADGTVKLGGKTVKKQTLTYTVTRKQKTIKAKKSGVNRQASASGVFAVAVLSSMYLCQA